MTTTSKEKLWIKEQNTLKSQLITVDCIPSDVNHIGGVDISFIKGDPVNACAALVVLDAHTLDVVYSRCGMVQMKEPYIAGFLAFREVNHLVDLIDELKLTSPNLVPEVIFVDGNGILHHRGFGLASHLGVLTGIPTIGIGKNLLLVDGITKEDVKKDFLEKCNKSGDYTLLEGDSGTVWGASLKTTEKVTNPIFVSIGHKTDLDRAIDLTMKTAKYRVPEAVRCADKTSRDYLRLLMSTKIKIVK